MSRKSLLAVVVLGLLAACAEPPMGPANDQSTLGSQQPPPVSQQPPAQPYCTFSSDLRQAAARSLPSSGAVAYEKQCTPVR
jgi:hypothetical protein